MKLPFVSRETLALALAHVEYFRAKAEAWEARYLEATKPKQAVMVEKAADPVAKAIRDAAGGNSALRGHLSHFARTEREAGTPEDTIVERIRAYERGPGPTRDKASREEADAALAEILDAP